MLVLAVCTGNICRSPAVERLLEDSPLASAGVAVQSAGTDAVVGAGVHEDTTAALAARGIDAGAFSARQLTPDLIIGADVVLALAREHRSRVVQLVPGALRQTYTISELARIADRIESAEALGTSPLERFATLVRHAPALRTAPSTPEDDDVEDPIAGPARAHETAIATIEARLQSILRVLV